MANFTNRSVPVGRTKAVSWDALETYRIDDDIRGYTVRDHAFRADYKRCIRMTRRRAKMAVLNNLAALIAGED